MGETDDDNVAEGGAGVATVIKIAVIAPTGAGVTTWFYTLNDRWPSAPFALTSPFVASNQQPVSLETYYQALRTVLVPDQAQAAQRGGAPSGLRVQIPQLDRLTAILNAPTRRPASTDEPLFRPDGEAEKGDSMLAVDDGARAIELTSMTPADAGLSRTNRDPGKIADLINVYDAVLFVIDALALSYPSAAAADPLGDLRAAFHELSNAVAARPARLGSAEQDAFEQPGDAQHGGNGQEPPAQNGQENPPPDTRATPGKLKAAALAVTKMDIPYLAELRRPFDNGPAIRRRMESEAMLSELFQWATTPHADDEPRCDTNAGRFLREAVKLFGALAFPGPRSSAPVVFPVSAFGAVQGTRKLNTDFLKSSERQGDFVPLLATYAQTDAATRNIAEKHAPLGVHAPLIALLCAIEGVGFRPQGPLALSASEIEDCLDPPAERDQSPPTPALPEPPEEPGEATEAP